MRSVCLDCGHIEAPTATTIDAIARLQLAARRRGCQLELANANLYLLELIGFVGLSGVLRQEGAPSGPAGERGGLQTRGQAEEWKQPGGIEEEGELRDPSAG
jgi:hypothetical protein